MRHDFILRNLYYDFVDIFRSFGLKPYLSPSVNDGCPQLADLLRMWCYKTDCDKDDIKTVTPVFRLLAKSCGKALDIVHAPKVLYRRDFRVSPLLPAMWAIIYNVKKHIDEKFFTTKCIDVFKAGKIMAGINLNTLDNVRMTTDIQPPYHPTPLDKIYDLKPLRTVEHIPISFFTFFVVVFKPRNIQDSELKPWSREVDYFQHKVVPMVRLPFINITLTFQQDDTDSPDKKDSRKPSEKLILHKNNVTAALLHMLDQAIELTIEVDTSNAVLQESGTAIAKFLDSRQFVAPNKRAIFDKIEIPQFEEPIETDAFTTTVLELIRNLQLGDYNNVFEAKRCLAGGQLLPPNFNHRDIITELRNFQYESVENVIQLPLTLTKLKRLLDMDLPQLEHLPRPAHDCEAICIRVKNEYARHIYDPLVLQKDRPNSPSWCTALVDMLKFVFNCDEWHHTMETFNEHDLRRDKDLKFLVYSNEFLNSLQPDENQQGSSSDSQDGKSSVSSVSSNMK